ncbi:MAG: peptidoglycan-binding protein, partial [Pseudomonadota bacterium]
RGVTGPGGDPLPQVDVPARMVIPAGHRGPAFLVFRNFDSILRYNASTSYALAVGHLADRIAGGFEIQQAWPTDLRPLSRSERKELQERLNTRGFGAGKVDGIIGANTRKAIKGFQKQAGLVADGYPSSELLQALRTQ